MGELLGDLHRAQLSSDHRHAVFQNGTARVEWRDHLLGTLRYYFPVVCQLIGIGGIVAGGPWVWLGVAQLPLFAVLDLLFGDDLRERKVTSSDAIMDIPVVLCAILGALTLMFLAWK